MLVIESPSKMQDAVSAPSSEDIKEDLGREENEYLRVGVARTVRVLFDPYSVARPGALRGC